MARIEPSVRDTHVTSLRLPKDTFGWLRSRAQANERSLSGEVRRIIEAERDREAPTTTA